jgi:hypothetical protein
VKRHQNPVDRKPFRSKADQSREQMLETKYRSIGNKDVAACVRHTDKQQQATAAPARDDDQMH